MSQPIRLAAVEPWDAGAPAIHGPDITGASANKPFLYAIPATGERPLAFHAEGLPDGLRGDARTGFITGAVKREGVHRVLLHAENRHGKAEKEFDKWTEMWRSIPDTADEWRSVLTNGFYADDHMGGEPWRPLVRPGKWNDLDMMALGPQFDTMTATKANRLTPDEQITHMTLWALYPSPLILSCALDAISDFELRLFANEEVLAVNQDRLGKAATRVREERSRRLTGDGRLRNCRIQARPLADKSLAVGVFNLAEQDDTVEVRGDDLALTGRFSARNLWERRDLGTFDGRMTMSVPGHGAQMLKVRPL